MDIDQLRKVQETAKNLKVHGIEDSTNEAVDIVNRNLNLGGNDVPPISISRADLSQGNNMLREQMKKREEDGKMTDTTAEMNGRLEKQADLINQQAKMIYELQNKMNEIIREIKKMQTTVPTETPKERQKVLHTEEKKEHPRSGGYNSDDVSIEKMFYSGSK